MQGQYLAVLFTTGILQLQKVPTFPKHPKAVLIYYFLFLVGGHWASGHEEVMLLPDARDLYAQKHPVSRPRIRSWLPWFLEKNGNNFSSDMLNDHPYLGK